MRAVRDSTSWERKIIALRTALKMLKKKKGGHVLKFLLTKTGQAEQEKILGSRSWHLDLAPYDHEPHFFPWGPTWLS